jgi:dienelactone hydrolase
VLIGHGAGGAKDSTWLDAVAQRWVAQGLAVAAIDLPLHGERTDAKLHDLLLDELTGRRSGLGLAGDFLQQASSDLSRAVSAIAEIPGVDPQRVAFAGFGVGAVAGIRGCADDSRLRAAALALPVGTSAAWLGDSTEPGRAFAPRPTLLVDASEDETAPADAEAAMSDFLAKQLGVGTPD